MADELSGLDTFPKLLMHHAKVRGERPAIREKDLGIWQTWTWKQFADEARCARRRAHRAGSAARQPHRAHQRQPPAPVRDDGGGAMPRRDPGATVPGRGRHGDGLSRSRTREIAFALRRGPGAGRQAARDPAAVPDAQAHLLRRPARHAPLCAAASSWPTTSCSSSAARRTGAIRPSWKRRSPRARPATPPAMFFTSGTTGVAKGVVHTHASLIGPSLTAARDGGPGRARRHARLPAAGLDRPEHLLLRAGRSSPATASAARSRPRR